MYAPRSGFPGSRLPLFEPLAFGAKSRTQTPFWAATSAGAAGQAGQAVGSDDRAWSQLTGLPVWRPVAKPPELVARDTRGALGTWLRVF